MTFTRQLAFGNPEAVAEHRKLRSNECILKTFVILFVVACALLVLIFHLKNYQLDKKLADKWYKSRSYKQ